MGHRPRGGGGLLLGDVCKKTGQPVADVLRGKHPDMRVPPVETPTYTAFEEYGEVPETVPLDYSEDYVTWVASNISGAGS